MSRLNSLQRSFTRTSHGTSTPTGHSAPPHSSSESPAEPRLSYEVLKRYYEQFPDPSIPPGLNACQESIDALRTRLVAPLPQAVSLQIDDILKRPNPTGLDQSMYSLRCACELSTQRLTQLAKMHRNCYASLHPTITAIAHKFEGFQQGQSNRVSQLVTQYLPKDFRASLFNVARQQSEQSNASAINHLVASGASIEDKYSLLWKQQYKRRETLASVGNATGIWKWFVKYLAGVPDSLLHFAKQINAPKGPTEALREKFGPALETLTKFAHHINALTLAALSSTSNVNHDEIHQCLEQGVAVYEKEVTQFLDGLEAALADSPFFVVPDQVPVAQ